MAGSDAVREIKARLNIVDLVRRYVDLKRNGPRWVAPCPFHQETKPSFSVNEEGFFYCFGCQAKGDLIDFYRQINGLEFRDALEELAREAGVELTRHKRDPAADAKARAERDFKRRAMELHALAVSHYQANLKAPAGAECREYLAGRKLEARTLEAFSLGYSLDDWRGLESFLQAKGVTPKEAALAGLLSKNAKGNIYDRFRNRLMFPITDVSGKAIAFGARVLSKEDEPKYLNSGESALYTKGDHLYGLAQARRAMSQSRRALLTEGYMDVLSLWQFGYENACGVLGTALTENQVKRLAGFVSSVDLIFDGDRAGLKAAGRSAEMLLARGMGCRVLLMPQGEDVDSLLQEHGADAFEAVLNQAAQGLDFLLAEVGGRSPAERLKWVRDFCGALAEPGLFALYAPRLAEGLGLDKAELREVAGLRAPQGGTREGHGARGAQRNPQASGGSGARGASHGPGFLAERDLLKNAVWWPEHMAALEEKADILLSSVWARELWDELAGAAREGREPEVSGLCPEARDFFYEHRMCRPEAAAGDADCDDLCKNLLIKRKQLQIAKLRKTLEMNKRTNELSSEDQLAFLRDISTLNQEIAELKPEGA